MAESTIVEIEQPVGASSNSALIATEGQKKLRSIPPIHKVPANIRKWNEGAYTPSNVSIGPYHCNSNIRREYFSKLNILISECAGRKLGVMDEFDIRHYYRETIDDPNYVTDKLFVRDAYLVIEIFLRLIDDARRIDLLLLENQLPFFFIEELFRREYANTSSSLIELTFDFFKEFNVLNIKPTDLKIEIEHFTDLLRTFYLPPSRQLPKRGRKSIKLLYTATQLQEAGVKIETRYVGNGYVTDYFLMMSSLAQSIEDMELLRHLKIVQGFDYKTDDALLSIVQDLCRDIESIDMNHDYILTFKKLKKFHNRPRNLMHMWKKPLKRDYFSNPWRTASTIAAIILLVLTFIQTVCSIIQVLPK
nr:UPF0481 protein At3g47200-like isoform X2 [Quercus suber]